jgi:hypothetical protein|uniref:Uncharacterized protein n=1 Tax=Chelativorans sp. (strain BNC1) TaxID=266779 RepID=Q11IP8_CHESB
MVSVRPRLKLIEGGGKKSSEWLSPPSTVLGKSPFDNAAIMAYRVAPGDLRKHIATGRHQPILDLWWHVYGETPPVPGAERYSSMFADTEQGLHSAHACFRGIMRPVAEDDRGLDYAAFVTKPKVGFRYRPSMSCVIEPYDIPEDLLFLIYAHLDFPEGRAYQSKTGNRPVTNGVVTHWQLVECDPAEPLLPMDYEARFRRRYW